MQPKDRRELILEQLNVNEKIEIDQLVEQLNVSAMTIRRDLNILEAEEKIIRTHGGAVLNKPLVNEVSFQIKETKYSQQKKRIAQTALQYIKDHSTILLDAGTTNLEIAKRLKGKRNLTVLTNDIRIAVELMDSDIKVIVTGGELQNNTGAIFGPLTEQVLKNIHVDQFFLGSHAVHIDAGITAPTFEKASMKQLMIECAEATLLVVDSSKFDQKSLAKVCDLFSIDGIITDDGIPAQYMETLKEKCEVIIAEGGEEW
ncbi:transcriptional regulator [[Bacillus] sp. KCTC 13219]|nr:transcriptional regulator [[Bacillus] sp. KCTC 13219]